MQPARYLPQLNGLRALGVFGVLFFHVYDIRPVKESGLSSLYDHFAKLRDLPIYFFFILSGYFITRILLELKDKPKPFGRFYLSRLLRILPLYYLVLIVIYIIAPGLGGIRPVPPGEQLLYWIPVANSAMALNYPVAGPEHFWTLCIEIQFYLLIPLLILKCPKHITTSVLLVGVILSLVGKIIFVQYGLNPYYSGICRMDVIALGCLAAQAPWPDHKVYYVAGLFGFAGIMLLYRLIFPNGPADWAFRLSTLAAGCLLILLYLVHYPGIAARTLSNKAFKVVSQAGYSIYAFHPFCLYAYYRFAGQHHFATDLLLCTLLALLAGIIGYRLIELPVNLLRTKLEHRIFKSAYTCTHQ